MRSATRLVAVAATYLAIALWAMRVVLPHPTVLVAYPSALEDPWRSVYQSDERMVTWGMTRNARAFLSGGFDMEQGRQCFPMAHSYALGEHMIAEGLLGAVPYAVSHDPLFTANAIVVLTLWLAALAMYALVFHWTQSVPAAFVAGFLFGFDPARIADPGHPFVHGNLWTPLALLFAHRLFAFGRWRDALALGAFIGVHVLESFYQLFALAILGGVYGVYLIARTWRSLPSLVPKLVAVVGASLALVPVVLLPYLRTAATWGTLSGRPIGLLGFGDFGFRGSGYPGTVALVLTLVAVVDRARGARRMADGDPRLVFLAGGLLAFSFVLGDLSPVFLLARIVPGLAAVRGLANLHYAVNLVAALLAGFGVFALIDGRKRGARCAITATIVALAAIEVFYPPVADRLFLLPAHLATFNERPRPDLLGVFRGIDEGAVLDLPFSFGVRGELRDMPYYLLLAAYHERPVAACYNSFRVPLQEEIETLANRLPEPAAADALYALGFRTIVLHKHLPGPRPRIGAELRALTSRMRVESEIIDHIRFGLVSPVPIEASFAALAAEPDTETPVDAQAPTATVPFTFRNRSAGTYRHPDPLEPTALVVRWRDATGNVVQTSESRTLLPLALAQGESTVRSIEVPVPASPGLLEVTLAPRETPDVVVARRAVRVAAGGESQ